MNPILLILLAWALVFVWVGTIIYTQRKVHPKALFVLFFAEMWERFSYYGMRSLLILYMTKELLYTDELSYGVYGAYGALVYTTPVLGGMLAERWFGYKYAIFIGGLLMTLGHFAMAFESSFMFYLALSLLILGNGFFKPNISSLVGNLYTSKDYKLKDRGFTLFYMGINVGAFLAPITCGTIGEMYSYDYGFTLAGVGMLLGLIVFKYGDMKKIFEVKGKLHLAVNDISTMGKHLRMLFLTLVLIPVIYYMMNADEVARVILLVVGVSVLIYLFFYSFKIKKEEKEKIWVILILFLFMTLFWSFFEQAGSSLTLFTDRNVDRNIFSFELKSSIFQSVNPFFIMLLVPLFNWMWIKLDRKGVVFSTAMKFSLALTQLGFGFILLKVGGMFFSIDNMVPVMFLFGAYFLHTTGELFISPIGLSLVTKLAPKQILAFVMGVWFLSSSFAHIVGVFISNLTALPVITEGVGVSEGDALLNYTDVFFKVGLIALVAALIILVLNKVIKKWMHGVY